MGQIMYMSHAREILELPDVRVICGSHRKNMQFPMVDVRFQADSIGYLGRDFMDDVAHREWVADPRSEVAPELPFVDLAMWLRPSWRGMMAHIERQLPSRLRKRMRKNALRRGFKWWLN